MNAKLARHVANVAIRSSTQLTNLVPLLKAHMEDGEYRFYLQAIAAATAAIDAELTSKLLAKHPTVKEAIEADMSEFGLCI